MALVCAECGCMKCAGHSVTVPRLTVHAHCDEGCTAHVVTIRCPWCARVDKFMVAAGDLEALRQSETGRLCDGCFQKQARLR